MPNSYQIYIFQFMSFYMYANFYANLHIYQVSCRFTYVKIHDLHVYKAMPNLHRSSLYPKLHVYYIYTNLHHNKFQPNYIYQDPCQIIYANPHSYNYHYNDNTQISSFMLMVNYPQTSNFHIMPSIPPNTYIPLGNIPIFPPYTIARIPQFRPM